MRPGPDVRSAHPNDPRLAVFSPPAPPPDDKESVKDDPLGLFPLKMSLERSPEKANYRIEVGNEKQQIIPRQSRYQWASWCEFHGYSLGKHDTTKCGALYTLLSC